MQTDSRVNILLVDDQPGKLLTYEAILQGLGETLLRAGSGREALEHLLKSEIAVILVDVCMPDLDGFQLAAMIREHPRFQKTAIIFISAIHLSAMAVKWRSITACARMAALKVTARHCASYRG